MSYASCPNCGCEFDTETEEIESAPVIGPLTREETEYRESDTAKYLASKLIERAFFPMPLRIG